MYSLMPLLIMKIQIPENMASKEDLQNISMASFGWKLQDYPNPVLDPIGCRYPGGPDKMFFLCDPDAVLTHTQGELIYRYLDQNNIISHNNDWHEKLTDNSGSVV